MRRRGAAYQNEAGRDAARTHKLRQNINPVAASSLLHSRAHNRVLRQRAAGAKVRRGDMPSLTRPAGRPHVVASQRMSAKTPSDPKGWDEFPWPGDAAQARSSNAWAATPTFSRAARADPRHVATGPRARAATGVEPRVDDAFIAGERIGPRSASQLRGRTPDRLRAFNKPGVEFAWVEKATCRQFRTERRPSPNQGRYTASNRASGAMRARLSVRWSPVSE